MRNQSVLKWVRTIVLKLIQAVAYVVLLSGCLVFYGSLIKKGIVSPLFENIPFNLAEVSWRDAVTLVILINFCSFEHFLHRSGSKDEKNNENEIDS